MLNINVLGRFEVFLDGQPVDISSRPGQSLLAYLLRNPNRPLRREKLAGMFWPDANDANARSNLRHVLWRIRKALEKEGEPAYVEADDLDITFRLRAEDYLDVRVMEEAPSLANLVEDLQRQVRVYQGELLPGFYDEWIILERERLQSIFENKMLRLVDEFGRQARWGEVIEQAEHWISRGHTTELAYRSLMVAHAARGDMANASAAYSRCVEALRLEIGIEPSLQTRETYQLLLRGEKPLALDIPLEQKVVKSARATEAIEPPAPGKAPFKGLMYYEESDAGLFFGREQLAGRLASRLKEWGFLAVIGASGSGKSSLLRAGLVPAIRQDQDIESPILIGGRAASRQIHILTPSAHPLENLAATLVSGKPGAMPVNALAAAMSKDSGGLLDYVRNILENPLLLIVDQFEELFTLCRQESERNAFIDNLLAAVRQGQEDSMVSVVIALRADFYAHCAHYTELREALARRQEFIGQMSTQELRRAIEKPAQEGGWEFEPGLVDLILRDVGQEPGRLPLLSHSLLETWKRRQGRKLSLVGYAASGGVHSAIARTAESVYQKLSPRQQGIARNIFLRLTELGDQVGNEDAMAGTRRRASLEELLSLVALSEEGRGEIGFVLNTLVDARLVTTEERTAEVAHEALIREWPSLRQWLAEDREGLALHRHLTEAAQAWENRNRDSSELYRGARLGHAREWSAGHDHELNSLELEFLNASRQKEDQERIAQEVQRQRELEAARNLAETRALSASRLRKRAVVLSIALVLAAIFGGAAMVLGQQARQKAQIAVSRELAAAAVSNLQVDPELSILLAIQAVEKTNTLEAENALHQALLASRLVAAFPARSQAVFAVALSPDGKRLASAGMDEEIYVWEIGDLADLPRREPAYKLSNPLDYNVAVVTAGYTLAFSPDGSRLAAVAEKHSVKIWDAASGQLLLILSGHQGDVISLDFSPDGKRLATSSGDGTAIVWDAVTGQQLVALPTSESLVSVRFTPDGKRLITGEGQGIARFWDLETAPAEELFSLTFDVDTEGSIAAIAFSPDGKSLAIGADNFIKVWDYEEILIDPASNSMYTLYGHNNVSNYITFTPDGSQLITASSDGTTRVWDANNGQNLIILPGASPVFSLALSPDGIRPITAHADGTVRIWDISPTASHESWVIYPAFKGRLSQDRKQLVTYFNPDFSQGKVKFERWKLSADQIQEISSILVDHGARVFGYAYNPEQPFYVTVGLDMLAKVWDAKDGQLKRSFPVGAEGTSTGHASLIFGADFNPEGTLLATGDEDGKVILWDLGSGEVVRSLAGHDDRIRGVTFSPDGTLLATTSFDRTARIWDVDRGQLLYTLIGHSEWVTNAFFSPDGNRLLTGSLDSTARMWDVKTGEELMVLKDQTSPVAGLDFSPDGTRIVGGSVNNTAIVWDAATGQAQLTLPGFHAFFGSEGKSLVTITYDGIVMGFNLDVEELVSLAQRRASRSLTSEECQKYLHTFTCP